MLEIFASWKWWQIALTAVFGTIWIVFIILDKRRKIAANKLRARREQGYSDEQIKEIIEKRIYVFCSEPGSGMSRHFVSKQKDGEK